MADTRKTVVDIEKLETAGAGFANGISTQLDALIKAGEHRSLNSDEKSIIIDQATEAYGKFLDALGVDWRNDPNSMDTPRRVAKKLVNDMWYGRYNLPTDITAFPSDGYDGCITQCNIPLTSMCSHHHESILGKVHISYVPSSDGKVVGLSKLNRIVEHFGRRGAIQEQLTVAIHNAVNEICEGNIGVGVQIIATHQCVSCRGVKHQGASMITTKLSGVYMDKPEVRNEFFKAIEMAL